MLFVVGCNCGAYKFIQHSLGLPVSIGCGLPGGRFVSVCSANQLAQHLALNMGIFVDKDRDRFGIGGQPITPPLDRVKKVAGSSGLAVEVSQSLFNRLGVYAAHKFANVLNLPSTTFTAIDLGILIDCQTQSLGQLQTRASIGF